MVRLAVAYFPICTIQVIYCGILSKTARGPAQKFWTHPRRTECEISSLPLKEGNELQMSENVPTQER
jgi:hypothetical protein